jgi:hypothetical protein
VRIERRLREGSMAAKGRRRAGKVKVAFAFRDRLKKVRVITLPPGASTGRHPEKKGYVVIPLTNGTIHLEIFRMVRGRERRTEEVRKLKKHRGYRRNVGKGGCHINLTNKGSGTLHIMKD